MAASLFTYSSTSRRVTPAPNSPPLPIHIKATNVVFNPDIPEVHRGLGLDDFVNFLTSCRLRYAISDVPSEFFPEQVCEFYYTATVNEENNAITGTIGHGRHSVFITAELLSAALRLPLFEPFSEPQLLKDVNACLINWAMIIQRLCVGHKSRSGDQLSNYEQQVVCSLLLNKRLDYGALFFDQLVQLLRANVRADHVPFPRWIALVFDKFFAADYFSHSGNPIQCPRMYVRMYRDDPLDSDIGISDRMREWIAHPYTMPSLSADTDEGGADGDHVDHADQEVDRYDGGHSSPPPSPHLTPVTGPASSAPQDPMSQGEQPSQGDHQSQGEHSSQGMPHSPGEHSSPAARHFSPRMQSSFPVAPGTSMIQIPASAFSELMSLTRDMSQRLLNIEADVQQIKEVLLLTPASRPISNDVQKGGDTDDHADDHADSDQNAHDDEDQNEKDTATGDNTILQHDSLKPIEEADPAGHDSPAATERLSDDSEHNDEHESDSAGHSSPAATEKLFEDSDDDEERDEPDDECQIFDMNFIDPLIPVQQESLDDLEESIPILADPIADSIIPVQGEDSDIASEESHQLSRKRKGHNL
ncbi:unnamed protein product [Lactuca saligna]|uniref:Uncharacterized protein n=1 Tax=Lactuca saligna TaxID=75948 RepID=A0AA36EDI0_LACSI|nr:unnamed protein product [Lactuca saligna]